VKCLTGFEVSQDRVEWGEVCKNGNEHSVSTGTVSLLSS